MLATILRELGSPSTDDAVSAVLDGLGFARDLAPTHWLDGLRRVRDGGVLPWVRLPGFESGVGWALRDVAALIPGAWYDEPAPGRTVLGVPDKRRALIVESTGANDRYAVVTLHASGRPDEPPVRTEPTILGTLVPTDDQVRRWAYDPDLRFATQDEEVALSGARPAVLIELARDAACPKRHAALGGLIDQVERAARREPPALDEVRAIVELMRTSGDAALHARADELAQRHRA
jgi:hypothetical protein